MSDHKFGNKDLYEAINELRREISESIEKLAERFEKLETGKVSILEQRVANIEGRIYVYAIIIGTFVSTALNIGLRFIK